MVKSDASEVNLNENGNSDCDPACWRGGVVLVVVIVVIVIASQSPSSSLSPSFVIAFARRRNCSQSSLPAR
jgi:hypothetical protein